MSVWACSMMRDESDIAEQTVRHLLAEGVERVIVVDHHSIDGTADVLQAIPNVEVRSDHGEGYPQYRVINNLVREIGLAGIEWVIPFDADEIWYAVSGRPLADVLSELPPSIEAVEATVWEHVPQPDDDPSCLSAMAHRRLNPWEWTKVAVRWHDGMELSIGNHEVHPQPLTAQGVVAVRHFPYRSLRQAQRKFAWKVAHANHLYQGDFDPPYQDVLSDTALAADWWRAICDPRQLICDPAPIRSD